MTSQSITNTSVFQITSAARSTAVGRKVSMPVDSSLTLYSRFKHVYGIPTTSDEGGIPLSSLRALDSLIERLVNLRGRNTYFVNAGLMNGEDAAFTIERLQKELNSLVTRSELPLTAGSEMNDMGLALNFVA
jgi:hypothetical protein